MSISLHQVDTDSHLRTETDIILNPRATTAALVVASVDPSTLASGQSLTLAATASGVAFRVARKVTLVLTDASGGAGGLSVTVQVNGNRFGKAISENVTTTCTSGAATTSTTTLVFDQVTSVVVRTITTAAVGDALTVGIDGTTLGLSKPIDSVNDVLSIQKLVSGVEQAPIAISSTTVDVANSAIVHGGTITAANDIFVVRYRAAVNKDDPGAGRNGVYA
jgi:hypothetical protein